MPQTKRYHLPSGGIIDMIRYGTEEGTWDPNGPAAIAMFAIGIDVNARTTQLNEQIWDVVQPIKEFWHPEENVADLVIKGQDGDLVLSLGQWLGRYPNGRLRPFADNFYISGGLSVTPTPTKDSLYEDLVVVMKKNTRLFTSTVTEDILARYLMQCVETFDKTVTDIQGSERQ